MAFRASYENILDKNLQYIYSGKDYDVPAKYNRMLFTRRQGDKSRYSSYKPRSFESYMYKYDKKYGADLPKAPAFRCFSRHDVSVVVNRLSSSKEDLRSLSTNNSNLSLSTNISNSSLNSIERKLSWKECDELSSRLNKPTETSKLRNLLQTHKGKPLKDLMLPCERCNVPSSRRFYPECYQENTKTSMASLAEIEQVTQTLPFVLSKWNLNIRYPKRKITSTNLKKG